MAFVSAIPPGLGGGPGAARELETYFARTVEAAGDLKELLLQVC